jgi:hypothetical protein
MLKNLLKTLLASGLVATLLAFSPTLAATELTPFHAEYHLTFAIFTGDVSLDLRRDDTPGNYVYKMTTEARGLAKAVLRRPAIEKTYFSISDEHILPARYHLDDGRSGEENKTDITFIWGAGKAYSQHEGEDLTIPIEAGTLDRLSADISVIMSLRAGNEPGSYPRLDGEDIDVYKFKRLGKERLEVPAGTFDTVKFRRQRRGSSRSTLIWFAPEQDYLPVRIDQQKDGKTSVTMTALLLQPESS